MEENTTRELGIHFGAMCDKISKQLTEQGFKFDKEEVKWFELEMEAITRLRIGGYLSDSVTKKCHNKLYTQIQKHVIKFNNLTAV